jgi:hypothetical protein
MCFFISIPWYHCVHYVLKYTPGENVRNSLVSTSVTNPSLRNVFPENNRFHEQDIMVPHLAGSRYKGHLHSFVTLALE